MPPLKEVQTLFDQAGTSFARGFIARFHVYAPNQSDANTDTTDHVFSVLDNLPVTIVNNVVAKILKKCCSRNRERDKICELLRVLLVSKLTEIDLSDLVELGVYTDPERGEFVETFLTALPKLTKVATLILATHTAEATLPICTDRILEDVSYCVQKLRVLDLSNNNFVTDAGLECLIPRDGQGCPLLEELMIFKCSVTVQGVTLVLENLRHLKILGYKNTGYCLTSLFTRFCRNHDDRLSTGLNLTHINQTVWNGSYYDRRLLETARTLCPFAFNLKVIVEDHHLPCFKRLTRVSSLDLTYRWGTVGKRTFNFFVVSGHQLHSLTITCPRFSSKHFTIIGKHCPDLQHFSFTCYYMTWDLTNEEIQEAYGFSHLQTLYFRVGYSKNHRCVLHGNVLKYILHNTSELRDLSIVCRSETLTDSWLQDLWQSFKTGMLHKVLIAIPRLNIPTHALPLTMASVNLILECSPQLKYLGNLRVWDVSIEEVEHLQHYLNISNYDIHIANSVMFVKSEVIMV